MSPGEEQYNGGGVSAARSARRACAKSASRRDVRKHSQQPAAPPLRIPLSPLPSRWSPLGVPLKERMTRPRWRKYALLGRGRALDSAMGRGIHAEEAGGVTFQAPYDLSQFQTLGYTTRASAI